MSNNNPCVPYLGTDNSAIGDSTDGRYAVGFFIMFCCFEFSKFNFNFCVDCRFWSSLSLLAVGISYKVNQWGKVVFDKIPAANVRFLSPARADFFR